MPQRREKRKKLPIIPHPAARPYFELWLRLPRQTGLLALLTVDARKDLSARHVLTVLETREAILFVDGFSALDLHPAHGTPTIKKLGQIDDEEVATRAAQDFFRATAELMDGRLALGAVYQACREVPPAVLESVTGHARITMEQIARAAGTRVRVVRHQVEQIRKQSQPKTTILQEIRR